MITMRERSAGITVATIHNKFASAEVSLYGGQVLSFKPDDRDDILFMSSACSFKPGKPIRGGIPICFPWFGPRTDDPMLPQHGFARTSTWSIISFEDEPESSTLILGLSDTEDSRRIWPHSFAAALAVTVSKKLSLTLSVTNTGGSPLSFTDALHAYFKVSQIESARLIGLEQSEYRDLAALRSGAASEKPDTRITQNGEIVFTGEIDRVYLTDSNIKIIDNIKPGQIIIRTEGFPNRIIWNPGQVKGEAIADLGKKEWNSFVCMEAGAVDPNEISVPPGATVCQTMIIEPKR
ncbi:MAG: D-hexose-6-phosphate mutarotase [Spirochaetales bacterium]|nr:D-hexose-6-phosphate mutarotase [Spirochaetales bacterium]